VATKPEFPAISPNNRIRAIVDNSPSDVGHRYPNRARSSYILLKTGKFLPRDLLGRIEVIEWLFWQIGGLGPMAGQNHHFKQYARHAIERYENETNRLHAVLNKAPGEPRLCGWRLFNRDIGAYPWIVRQERQSQRLAIRGEWFPRNGGSSHVCPGSYDSTSL